MPRAAETAETNAERLAREDYENGRELVGEDLRQEAEFNINAIFDLPEVQARMQAMAQEAARAAVQLAVTQMNPAKAPLTMRANVADRFITGSNNPEGQSSPHLKHYRCERLKSDKIIEYDMPKLMSYLNGEKEAPEDKEGRTRSIPAICVIRGAWISFLNGHCYAYTENQVQQLEWMKTQPRSKGGLPDLYEDPGGEIYTCKLCPGLDPFGNKEGWSLHMQYVHGVITDFTPGIAPAMFANTSPEPFAGVR
jgi:hypothetical protein